MWQYKTITAWKRSPLLVHLDTYSVLGSKASGIAGPFAYPILRGSE